MVGRDRDRPRRRNAWPEPGVTQLWVLGMAGASGEPQQPVSPSPSHGYPQTQAGHWGEIGVLMEVITPLWAMHGAAESTW